MASHFVSYGDQNFSNSIKRIRNEAENMGIFSSINIYDSNNIYDEVFKTQFNYVLNRSKGSGYWIWKYYLIQKKLQEIEENDFIVYCDAGCSLNPNGKDRYYEYLELLNQSEYGILSFQLDPVCVEKHWTTKELFDYFCIDVSSEHANTAQMCATVLIIKKNAHSENILKEYRRLLEFDQRLITDYYNQHQQPFFKDARHDQSIWSLLCKRYGSVKIPLDETIYHALVESSVPNWGETNTDKYKYPFWATRIKY
jgi:hypothetical protein